MKLIAKFIKALQPTEGETDRGHWVRGGIVVRTLDERETLVAFTVFGAERVNRCKILELGDVVRINFEPESREFENKWFTELRLVTFSVLGRDAESARTDDEKGGEQ